MFGTTGIRSLWGKEAVLNDNDTFLGGGMIHEVNLEGFMYAKALVRFEAGTHQNAQAIGLGKAIEYLENVFFLYGGGGCRSGTSRQPVHTALTCIYSAMPSLYVYNSKEDTLKETLDFLIHVMKRFIALCWHGSSSDIFNITSYKGKKKDH